MGAATGIALGHAATHRHQILASISLHDRIRRARTSIVLIMNMKNRSGDGVVGKARNRIRKPIATWPVHRRRMNTAVDLAAEILCQPPRADCSHAMSHHENLRKTVLVPEPGDDASHIVGVLSRRPIAVKASSRARPGCTPLVGGAIHDHQRNAFFCKNVLIHSHERLQVTLLVRHGLNSCNARVTPKIQECRVGRFGRLGQDRPLEHRGFCEDPFRSPPVDLDQYIGLRMRKRNAK